MRVAEKVKKICNLNQLLDAVPGVSITLRGKPLSTDRLNDCAVEGLCLDSRQVQPGDVFFALQGTQAHGLSYARQVEQAGACAIVWQSLAETQLEDYRLLLAGSNIPCIEVTDLPQHLGAIASRFYAHPSEHLSVIAITGTDGKTSCTHLLAHALQAAGKPTGTLGTLGYGMLNQLHSASHTTPDAIRMHHWMAQFVDAGASHAVIEASSHGIEQGRVNGLKLDTALFTNLTRDHLDYHGTVENYAAAKRRLFEMPGLRRAVIYIDDEYGRQFAEQIKSHCEVVAVSTQQDLQQDPTMKYIVLNSLKYLDSGLELCGTIEGHEFHLQSNLLGGFNATNLMFVVAVLYQQGVSLAQIESIVPALQTVPGRMELFLGKTGAPKVVVDYAHTPAALQQVLSALRRHCRGELYCVFGCGGDRDKGKRPLMAHAVAENADQLIVTNDNPRNEDPMQIIQEVVAGLPAQQQYRVEPDREQAIRLALTEAKSDDWVLVAGKGHEDYQILGDRRLPFSDRECVRRILREAV